MSGNEHILIASCKTYRGYPDNLWYDYVLKAPFSCLCIDYLEEEQAFKFLEVKTNKIFFIHEKMLLKYSFGIIKSE